MMRIDEVIAQRAAGQHGVFTRAQAEAVGCTRRMIDGRVSSGRWVRVGPTVYRLAGAPVTWKQRVLAACLASGPRSLASHRTAAALFNLSGFRPGPVAITIPDGRSPRNPLATVHRTTSLPTPDRARVDRIPATAPVPAS